MLRVEVGALGAHQVKNMRGEGWTGAKVQGACVGGCGYFGPGWASHRFFLIGYSSCAFVVVSSLVSLVSRASCFQPGAGVSWL